MTSGVTLSGRLTELISLSRVDELILAARDHWHLEADDECYYLGEYTPREGYTFSATNDLIINFKKPLDRRGRPEYQHKLRAIVKAATRLRDAIPPEWHAFTFVPIPPSKSKTDPLYDARLIAMLTHMSRGLQLDIRELLVQDESTPAAHEGYRPTVTEYAARLRVNEEVAAPVPATIAIVDDVLTTGCHFKAAQEVLRQRFGNVRTIGVFLARVYRP